MTISSGVISVRIGMLPAMKITEPYSPTPRAKASANPVSAAGSDRRKQHAYERLQARRAETRRHLLELLVEILEHRLHRAHDERQADERERHDDAEARERNVDPELRQRVAEPPFDA